MMETTTDFIAGGVDSPDTLAMVMESDTSIGPPSGCPSTVLFLKRLLFADESRGLMILFFHLI